MAIYTYRLGATNQQAPGAQVLFTTQSGQHVIIRDLVFTNLSANPAFGTFFIQSADQRYDLQYNLSVPSLSSTHWDGRQELRLNEQLYINTDATSWSAVATGYVFQLL